MGVLSNIIGGIGKVGGALLGGVGKVGDALFGTSKLIGTGYNIYANEKANRIDEQRYQEQRAWQSSENEIMRAREDNAVQRHMQDLKTAGINPILAGGGQAGASSGGVTPMQQSRKDETSGQMIANLISQKAQFDNMKAQTEVAKAQAENIKAQTEETREKTKGYDGSRQNISADTELKKLRKEMDNYDFKLSRSTNTKTNASGIVADITNAINAISGALGKENVVNDGIDYAKNSIQEVMDITNKLANVPPERREEIEEEIKREVPKLIEKAPERVKNEWYESCKNAKYNPLAWAVRQTESYKEWVKNN